MTLFKYNRHWEKKFQYPYKKHRTIFNTLIKELSTRQIVEISGLRRTGKTTLLFQVLNYLINQKKNPFSLLYFTFDDEKLLLDDLINDFSKQTQIDIEKNDTIVPIEIKYKEKIQLKDLKNLLLFSKKFRCKKAIIFKKGIDEKSARFDSPEIEITEKPIYKF